VGAGAVTAGLGLGVGKGRRAGVGVGAGWTEQALRNMASARGIGNWSFIREGL